MKKAVLISGVFISSIIGAGFASGSEVLFYFSKFKGIGLIGIIIACFLLSLLEYLILIGANRMGVSDYDAFLTHLMRQKCVTFIATISYIFMIFLISAMLSGFGELLYTLFGIKKLCGAVIMLIITLLIIRSGYDIFVKSEGILAMFITLFTVTIGGYLIISDNVVETFSDTGNMLLSSVSYVSYNILTLSSVLCLMGRDTTKQAAKAASVITFFVLTVLMMIFYFVLRRFSSAISYNTLPMLDICLSHSEFLGGLYSIILFCAMLTTAVSNAYVVNVRLNKRLGKYSYILIGVCSFFISSFDFSFIVDKMYRITGILSLFLVYFIIKNNFIILLGKQRKSKKY